MYHGEPAGENKDISIRIAENNQINKSKFRHRQAAGKGTGLLPGTGGIIVSLILVICLFSSGVSASDAGSLSGYDTGTIIPGGGSLYGTDDQSDSGDTLPVTDDTSSGSYHAASPIQPHEFYGTVTVGGVPAPVGTVICATINGEERGTITTTVSGQYGSPNWLLPRLSVIAEDETEVGQTIQFHIDGEDADQTATYVAGATTNLPLTRTTTTYIITATAGTGGTISPLGEVIVPSGSHQVFTVTADTCYSISDVIVDGTTHLGPQYSPYSYTFWGVDADHSIAAVFSETIYTITSTAGPGGAISPSGETTVVCGSDITYTITPDTGYSVEALYIDGIMHEPVRSYTFTDVTADHEIEVSFTTGETCTITPVTAMGGTISPSTPQTVAVGSDVSFTMTADSCHTITDVIIDSSTHLGPKASPYSYTFENVETPHTIQPVFSSKSYIITATAGSGGTISPSGETTVVCGSDLTYIITPDTGYVISELIIDGVLQSPVATYTFTGVTADHTIHATFTTGTMFQITATATSGGTISPSGVTEVSPGGSQLYTITPDAGHVIQDVLVDGVSIGGVSTYTFTEVQADHTIHAVFTTGETCTITPVAAMGGTINPSTPQTVAVGSDVSFIMTADSCYVITDVIIDSSTHLGPKPSSFTYTFEDVQKNHTIRPVFSSKSYTIMATAETGGSISPSGEVTVVCGSDVTFTIAPDAGYDYTDLLVDGQSVGTLRSYTFSSVTADHTIHALFAPQPTSHIITATAEEGGFITPSGAVVVADGGEKTFTIGTDSCYVLQDVLVDGASVGAVRSYTFTSVTVDHTIHLTVSRHEYQITASAGTGGSINPAGTISFWCGTDQTFTISPENGYHIKDVLVDGGSVGPVRSYTFSSISSDHIISAIFEGNVPGKHVISATAGEGGTITPSGAVMVSDGDEITFTITPDTAYGVQDIVVDGQYQGPQKEFTFSGVVADHTIHAIFSSLYPAPVADFSGMPVGGPAPLRVEFFDLSTGYLTAWEWTFSHDEGGQPIQSEEQNPVITFEKGGNWDVSLTVTDFYGRTATKTVSSYIHVGGSNLPYASFTISPESGIAPLTVTFTDSSTGEISSWHWDFGDESTSTEQNPVHTYEEAGEYIATLQVSNAVGSTKASRKIVVNNEPHHSSLSLPGGVFYRKAGDVTWQYHQIQPLADQFNCWEYTTSYQPSPQRLGSPYVVTYENYPQSAFTLAITDYNKNLVLDDTYQFIYCIAGGKRHDQLSFAIPDETDMVVQAVYYESRDDSFTLAFVSPAAGATIPPAMTDIRVEAKGSGLDPDHILFIDPTGTDHALSYNQQSGLFEGSFDATPYLGQTITLSSLAERTGGYPDVRTEIAVTVSSEPVTAGFTGSPREGTAPLTVAFLDQSQNNPTTWQWMFGDGSISNVENPTHTYEKPGSYSVTLSVTNARSEDTITREDYISVSDPGLVADFEVIPRSGKKPLTIAAYDLSIGDIVSWDWIFAHDSGSTPVQSFEQDPVVTLDKGGNWDVTLMVTDSGGLTATCTKKNYVHVGGPQPVLEPPIFSADPVSGNQPLETSFTVISPDTAKQWYWDFGDTKTSYEKDPVHTYEKAGTYSPQLTIWSDENSATTAVPRAITVKKISDDPVALFSADPVCLVAPGKVWFTDRSQGSIVSWVWDFGDGSQSDKQNPVHTYTQGGVQTVTLMVTDATGRQDTLTRDTYITVNPAGGGTPNNALVQKTQGTISEGQTSTDTVMIDSSIDSFSTLLNWPGSILGFSLTLPDGTRIITDPASQTGTTSSNVYYSSGPTYAVYDVKNSVPGEYTIEVTAYETDGDEPYAYVVLSQTEVYIEAELGSEVIVPGTPIEVSARLLSGDTPITEPSLSATCTTPGGSVYDIPLTLNENFSYTGLFAGTTTPGIYTVTITTDGNEIQRTAILSCESQGFVIETVAGANGSISPFGDVYVSAGDTPAFTVLPDTGYRVSDLIVDDVSIGPQIYYQFDPVHADHTLEALFIPDTPAYDFVLPLSSGWNLVSIPRYPIVGQDTLGRLFGGIDNEGHSIFMYNATTQSWDIPFDTHPVTPLEAYFVYSASYLEIGIMFDKEKPIEGVMLMPRWNLVGYSETNPYQARAFLASLGEAWTFILGFDADDQVYEETIIRGGTGPYSDTRLVNPGKGYWLYSEEEIFFLPTWG